MLELTVVSKLEVKCPLALIDVYGASAVIVVRTPKEFALVVVIPVLSLIGRSGVLDLNVISLLEELEDRSVCAFAYVSVSADFVLVIASIAAEDV